MTLSQQIGAHLPFLRRYARALTGSQTSGDAYVRATLEAALADPTLAEEIAESKIALYSAFTRIWTSSQDIAKSDAATGELERAANARLATIPPLSREALLLTALEEFSIDEAAQILSLDRQQVNDLILSAENEIKRNIATDVLIIEDQPLIALQLEGIVSDLGHNVVGTAATRQQALELFGKHEVKLVLADIQLADGSSGIDAVEEMLSFGNMPVIFITAYPERLLTGERPEPTYLITKPFQEAAVRAAISQALFFGSSQRVS